MKDLSQTKLQPLSKKILVIGFGSQGSSQAQNLKDSGFNLKVALESTSISLPIAKNLGFEVVSFEEGLQWADVAILLIPDEHHGSFFAKYVVPNFKEGGSIIVGHGFSFHFGYVKNFAKYNIGMVAPKAVGKAVRSNFLSGVGIFSIISKFHTIDENLTLILEEIAFGIGSKKIFETTFQVECESDLFGEQSVLCGGVVSLFSTAFDVMVKAGFPPLIAYYECVHELKLIVDIIYEKGVNQMFSSISNTAKFGGFKTGDFLIDESIKSKMQEVLSKIQDGSLAKSFMLEAIEKKYQFKQEIANKFQSTELERAGQEVINLLK